MVAARCKFRISNSAPLCWCHTVHRRQVHDHSFSDCFLHAISVDDGNTSIVLQEIKDAG
jgi:hypothetical protein